MTTTPTRTIPATTPPETTDAVGTALLVAAGALLLAFPLLRPWQDADPGGLATALAEPRWVVAHTAGMLGFLVLALGLRRRAGGANEVLAWLGAGLVLPYFGAETFGLHAVATTAGLDDATLLATADAVRYSPLPVVTFGAGLVLLGVVGVRLGVRTWRAGTPARAAGLLTAVGLVGYLPQFFLPPTGRVMHGVVLAVGLVGLALTARARRVS